MTNEIPYPIAIIALVFCYGCALFAGAGLSSLYRDWQVNNRNKIKTKLMNAKAALCLSLLKGDVLNVMNCLRIVGLSNCSREISRMIEQPFGVEVSRTEMKGESRYGKKIMWYNFRLNHTDYNKEGIKKMKEYVQEHINKNPKTEKESAIYKQTKMML